MYIVRNIITPLHLLLLLSWAFPLAAADWRRVESVEDTVAAYPVLIAGLLNDIALTRPELAAVAEAKRNGDAVAASRALLTYYRDNGRMARYRAEPPPATDKQDDTGEAALKDTYSHNGLTRRIPRGKDGRLDWNTMGPHGEDGYNGALHRHQMIRPVWNAWRRTGNVAYARHADLLLRDWLVGYHDQAERQRWKHNRNIDTGIRLFQNSLPLFYASLGDGSLSPSTQLLLLASLPSQAQFLIDDPGDINLLNFSSFCMSGLMAIGAGWPELAIAERARRFALERLRLDLDHTIYQDGVQKEMSMGYHVGATDNFSRILDYLGEGGYDEPPALRQRLEAMIDYFVVTLKPDARALINGDTAEMDYAVRGVRARAEAYGRPDWLGIVSNGAEGRLPEGPPSRVFPWGGVAIFRTGWGRQDRWCYIDAGPFGSGHGDPDRGHISLHAFGRDLLVDTGKFPYSGKLRHIYRWTYGKHSRGHNVVLVDDCSQAWLEHDDMQQGKIGVAAEALDPASYTLADGFAAIRTRIDRWSPQFHDWNQSRVRYLGGRAVHSRGVLALDAGPIVVVDHLATDRQRRVTVPWHFHPECSVELDGTQAFSVDAQVGNLRIVPVGAVDWQAALKRGVIENGKPQGWYCVKSEHTIEKTTAAVYEATVADGAVWAWVLLPVEGAVPEISAELEGFADGAATVTVAIAGGGSWRLQIPVTGGSAVATQLR